MSKLVAEGGQIKKQSMFVSDTLTVEFKRAAIARSGDIGEVIIKSGLGTIIVTYAQAISLANEILRRCQ
jgi:hypothetical protein